MLLEGDREGNEPAVKEELQNGKAEERKYERNNGLWSDRERYDSSDRIEGMGRQPDRYRRCRDVEEEPDRRVGSTSKPERDYKSVEDHDDRGRRRSEHQDRGEDKRFRDG